MQELEELIPPPPVVRDRLAACLRQTNLLRRLLRLSVRVAEELHRQRAEPRSEAARPEAVAS